MYIQPVYRSALALFIAIAAIRFVLLLPVGIAPDEAYYWTWAFVPSLSYFDHTAGIGWLGWLWLNIAGPEISGFRALNGVLSVITGLSSLAACLRLLPEELASHAKRQYFGGAFVFAVVLGLIPVQLNHLLWVPDSIYAPFYALALWQICRLLGPERRYEQSRQDAWIWAGIFFGGAILGKATMVPLVTLFGLICIFSPRLRADLSNSVKPWIGLLIIIIAGLPTLYWNSQNDWIMMTYQQLNAFGGNFGWASVAGLLAGYILVLGPILGASFKQNQWFKIIEPRELMALFLGISLLYFGMAFRAGLQLQWAIPAFHLGLILFLPSAFEKRYWVQLSGSVIISFLVIAVLSIRSVGMSAANTYPAIVWPEVYHQLSRLKTQTEFQYQEDVLLLANRYQDASLLNYSRAAENGFDLVLEGEANSRTILPALNMSSRSNHYDFLWPDLQLGGGLAIVVVRGQKFPPQSLFHEVLESGKLIVGPDRVYAYSFGRLIDNPRSQLRY